jgi:hypothetical protein
MVKPDIFIGMSEDTIRQKVVDTALSLLGIREGTTEHKEMIVDVYNSLHTLPRGHTLTTRDAWCAATMTVIGIMLGIPHVILPECSCVKMIELYRRAGRWEERDDYVPRPGDLVMYDWDATSGECTGSPDHVGMVVSVNGKTIRVIEGNYDNQVKTRDICVEYIKTRGFCLPDYASLVRAFSDVVPGAWYAADVARAAELGIVEGVGGGLFDPDRPATRAEIAVMMVRLFDALKKS